jgi:predicted nucleic acid-binding protein
MVSAPVLFDTNILIDYLSARREARIELDRHSDRSICIIAWMEIMVGSTAEDEDEIRAFLMKFQVVPLSQEIAERAVKVRRATKIKLPDAIVKATAEISGRTLVTRNTRDFPSGTPGVRIPYTL